MAPISTLEVLISARNEAGDTLTKLQSQLEQVDRTANTSSRGMRSFGDASRSAGADALRLAQTEARGLGIKGELVAASERLGSAIQAYRAQMGGTTSEAIKLANAENQLASVQQKIAGTNTSVSSSLTSLKSSISGLTAAAGGLGIALGAQQIVQFGVSAAQSALQLQQSQNALRQIAGDTQTYNQILAAARQQQVLFGGSLSDNLTELSTFAVQARTTGASLDELIRTAQRLATLDPAQGIQGAKIAMAEALSGDPTSLARRFEIPKAALDGLRDSSTSATDKLRIINQYLTDAGIAANGMADAVPEATKSINEMSAALDKLKTSLGGALSQSFTPAAQNITALADAANGSGTKFEAFVSAQQSMHAAVLASGQSFNPLIGAVDAFGQSITLAANMVAGYDIAARQANAAALQGAADFQAYSAAVTNSGQGAALLTQTQFQIAQAFIQQGQSAQLAIQNTQALTDAQLAYVTAQTQQGVAIDTAIAQAQTLDATFNAVAVATDTLRGTTEGAAVGLGNVGALMIQAASGGAQSAATVNELALALQNGAITAPQFFAKLQDVINANIANASATQQAQAATDPYVQSLTQARDATQFLGDETTKATSAMVADIAQKQKATQETNVLNAVQAALAQLGPAVASGLISDANAATILAGNYGIAKQKGLELLTIQAQLARQDVQLKAAQVRVDAGIARTGVGNADEVQRDRQAQRAAQTAANNQRFAEAQKAQHDYNLAVGDASTKLNTLQGDLDAATKRYGENSAAAIRAKQALVQFEQSQAKAGSSARAARAGGGGGGGGGAVKLSDQQKLNNTLAANQQRADDQAEEEAIRHAKNVQDIQQQHADKLLDIQQRYYDKLKAQADRNEVDKRENEVGFLERLTSSDLNKSTTGGQAELQRINAAYYEAFDKSQKAAQQGDLQRSEELLKLANDRASLELDYAERIDAAKQKKDQNEVTRLQTLLGLRRQVLDVQDQQAAQAGDSINAEHNANLADEQVRYSKALADETGRNTSALEKLTRTLDNKSDLATNSALLAGKNVAGTTSSALTPVSSAAAPSAETPLPVAPVTNADNPAPKLDAIAGKLDALIAAIGNVANHNDISGVVGALGSVGRDIKGAVSSMPRAFG